MVGASKFNTAFATPGPGATVESFRYFHDSQVVSGEPAGASATQSSWLAGPFVTVTVIGAPGFTEVVDTLKFGVGGTSSLVIVTTPWASPRTALVGLLRLRRTVSFIFIIQ